MMHTTTYSSSHSSIISLRTYSTFNDYSICSLEKCPSIFYYCCCSIPINSCKLTIPTIPSFLYGLRQSTLIQCPPSRKFMLGSGDRHRARALIYDVGRCGYCVRQERVGGCIRMSCNQKCCVKEKRGLNDSKIKGRTGRAKRDFRSSALGDAEAILSLLSEVSVEEYVVVREKRRGVPKEGRVVNEECKDRKRNDMIDEYKDRRQNVVIERVKDRRPNVELKNYREESGGRVQGYKKKEEQESNSKDEDGRLRRRESSSSYYSLSDFGGFESDVEVEVEKEEFVGESSTDHKKDSGKNGGVVISELTKEDWERRKDEKNRVLRSSHRDDLKVGSSIQRDWRKKSEKKLTEESVETSSRTGRQSQLSEAQQRSSMIASSSKTQLNFHEKQSDVTSHRESSSHILKDNKSSSHHEHSTQKNRENAESTSTAGRRLSQGEDSKMVGKSVQETRCEYCKTCGRNMENNKTQSDFQRHAEPIEMSIDAKLTFSAGSLSENRHRKHEKSSSLHQSSVEEESKQHYQSHVLTGQANAERKSQHRLETISSDDVHAQSTLRETLQSEAQVHISVEKSKTSGESKSESRRKKEEKSSSSLQISAKEENNQHNEIYQETSEVDARRKFGHYHGILDTDATYSQNTLRSQLQSETGMKHLEKNTASLIAVEKVKKLREESGGKETKDIESSNTSRTEVGDSGVHSSNLEFSSHSTSDKSAYNEQTYTKSKVKSVEDSVEKRTQIDETIIQSTLRTEEQGPSTAHFPGDATISQPSIPFSRTGVQQFSEEEVRSGQLLITSPPYQDVSWSQFHEASSSSVKIDTGSAMEVGSGSLHKHPQAITLSSYSEVYDSETMSGEEYTPEGLLLSAARMQESSALIVGEILEQITLEASTSETSTEKKFAKLDSKHQDKIYMLKESSESDSDKTGSQKQGSVHPSRVSSSDSEKKELPKLDSKHSSSDSGTKGSSDQMWDVKDHFVHEASEMESLEGAASEGVGVVRTGKSLWSTIAGVCRLRWGSRSENQKSPVKKKTSSSGSAGGESWFSRNEEGEANDDGMKAEQLRLLQKTTSDHSLPEATKSQKEEDVVMSLDAKLSHVDVDASSSSSVLQSSSLSGDAAVGENSNLNVPQHISLPSPLVDLSMPSVRQLRRTHGFEEIAGDEKYEAPISPSEEQRNYDADVRQTNDSASKETDAEMKKRKLQRSKVVLQRFDEWEDAFRRDREQRKVDEIFMREALSEAMKAADSWEVPVGAVLVQNGKIIARGYNLVEELRDSTAHAEMLCIREASNVLRTWRLSETTLYVTLEPCPMCAGAILQARIGTLVWGAPNKLLGADGSWIRLFPADMEGEQHSELTEKPAAPVHPFHPKMNIRRGILQEECSDIMQQFFQLKRKKAKEKAQKDTSSSDESGQPSCFPKPHHRSRLLHKMHNVFQPPKQ